MKANKLILLSLLPLLFILFAFLMFWLGAGFDMIVIPAGVFSLFYFYWRKAKNWKQLLLFSTIIFVSVMISSCIVTQLYYTKIGHDGMSLAIGYLMTQIQAAILIILSIVLIVIKKKKEKNV